MELSFPSDEYRTYDEQKALLDIPAYSIYAMYSELNAIKAFIALWEFNKFIFIEHFAVNPEFRNNGIGAYMLNKLADLYDKTLCLEVEPPDTDLACRRIGFYKRNNFFFNEYPYIQPSISQGKEPIPLFIMTSGNKVGYDTFEQIENTLYEDVYRVGNKPREPRV